MIPFALVGWAQRWGLPPQAFAELRALVEPPQALNDATHSEAYVQSQVRLEAAALGVRLWRNNVGVLKNEAGTPVRFGLANDSPALNAKLKSSDLVGWRPVSIKAHHVGTVIAQVVTRECKPQGWKFTGTDRELAQQAWNTLVLSEGGDAAFTTGPGSL
jgi:hypothetical protein